MRLQEFELACPPPDFWCRFLANQSDFFRHFHAARGDSAIRLFKWQRHFKVSGGFARWPALCELSPGACDAWHSWALKHCTPHTWRVAPPPPATLCCTALQLIMPRCAVLRLLCCACCAALCCLQVGMVRDLQFVTPVKARIGPPQAACHQTQRLQVGAGPLS